MKWRYHRTPEEVAETKLPGERAQMLRETGMADCRKHGHHADWKLERRRHPQHGGEFWWTGCRPCMREASRRWTENHPGHQHPYYRTVRGKANGLMGGVRQRVKKFGLECTISADWIVEQVEKQGGRCAYTGWRFDNAAVGRGYARNFFGMSIDKVDPRGGYTPENTRIVCWGVNRAKGDIPMERFVAMCTAIAESCSAQQ